MAHVADLLVLLGVVLTFPHGVCVGWRLRGQERRRTVILDLYTSYGQEIPISTSEVDVSLSL